MNKFEITSEKPTTIVKDFDTFVEYLENTEIVLTEKAHQLPIKALGELDAIMSSPLNMNKRLKQDAYPMLNFFFHIVIDGKIFHEHYNEKKYFLKPTEYFEQYKELTTTEKYIFLVEIFWCKTDWSIYFMFIGMLESAIEDAMDFIKMISKAKPNEIMDVAVEGVYRYRKMDIICDILEWFGMIQVTQNDYFKKNKCKCPEKILVEDLGKAICKILLKKRNFSRWNKIYLWNIFESGDYLNGTFDEDEIESWIKSRNAEDKEEFFQAFTKLFKEKELSRSVKTVYKILDGEYLFSISICKTSCKISINGNQTLLELHNAIQEAFGFDNDHLYSFFMDGKKWSNNKFASPNDDAWYVVDEIEIRELTMLAGQRILYLFDYGDQWEFNIVLEKVDENIKLENTYKIFDMKGPVIKQYENYDEEEYEDEE